MVGSLNSLHFHRLPKFLGFCWLRVWTQIETQLYFLHAKRKVRIAGNTKQGAEQ